MKNSIAKRYVFKKISTITLQINEKYNFDILNYFDKNLLEMQLNNRLYQKEHKRN